MSVKTCGVSLVNYMYQRLITRLYFETLPDALVTLPRAVIALDLERYFAKEAEKRRLQNLKQNTTDVQLIAHREENGRSVEKAATALNTNKQYVKDAKNLETGAPDLFEQVRSGEINIPEAKKKAKARKTQAARTVMADKAKETAPYLRPDTSSLREYRFNSYRAIYCPIARVEPT